MPFRALPRTSSARERFMRARAYAGRVARLHAEVFKPTPLRTFWASVGGPWSSYRAFSTPSNITLRLRSRWDAEAGSCRREYVHHVALPSSGSFSLEEPCLFPASVFFGATEGLTHPDRRAGRLVHDHHWPPVSLSPSYPSHSHRVHSSAPNAVALIINSQVRTTHARRQ
jgi:hypothetical protein